METVVLVLAAAALALIVRSALGVARIIRGRSTADTTVREDREVWEFQELLARRDAVAAALRAAELDAATGKIASSERERVMVRLEREAAAIMRRIEALEGRDEDRAAAAAELASMLATIEARGAGGAEGWSPAALARHGGRNPAEAQ